MAGQPDDALSPAEIQDARRVFAGKAEGRSACVHCGGIHVTVYGLHAAQQPCPRVRSITWHIDGVTITHVDYWPHGRWPVDGIVFPDQVYVQDPDDTPEQEPPDT
jgi:hypothetical protein